MLGSPDPFKKDATVRAGKCTVGNSIGDSLREARPDHTCQSLGPDQKHPCRNGDPLSRGVGLEAPKAICVPKQPRLC